MINLISASMEVNSVRFLEDVETGQTQKGRLGRSLGTGASQRALNLINLKTIGLCKCQL